jgi:hypothetical protein
LSSTAFETMPTPENVRTRLTTLNLQPEVITASQELPNPFVSTQGTQPYLVSRQLVPYKVRCTIKALSKWAS